jgi:hypothetical protein
MNSTAALNFMSNDDSEQIHERKQVSLLNTGLLGLVLAVAGFIAHTAIDQGQKLAAIQASQVTRPEVMAEIDKNRTELAQVNARVAEIMTRIAVLEKASR